MAEIRTDAGRALKLLVAEDNIINQRLVMGLLKALGHTGVIVGDGGKALKCLAQLKFDAVLMDVMMPHMDGLEALAVLRAREQVQGGHIPVIMATAHIEPEDQVRFRKVGADGYVAKPIDLESLAAELARVVAV